MKDEMFVVAFAGEGKAQVVLDALEQMEHAHVIDLEKAAVVVRDSNGVLSFKGEEPAEVGESAVEGAEDGAYSGASNWVGVVIGSVLGAIQGLTHRRPFEFTDDFLLEVSESLQPDSSAIVVLIEFAKLDKAIEVLNQFHGGKILRHTLTPDHLKKLSEAVED